MVITVVYKENDDSLTQDFTMPTYECVSILQKGFIRLQDNTYSKVLKQIYDLFKDKESTITHIAITDNLFTCTIININKLSYEFTFKTIPSEYLMIEFGDITNGNTD